MGRLKKETNEIISDEVTMLDKSTDEIYSRLIKTLGMLINKQRLKLKISLRQLYKKTNVSVTVISELENGVKIPRIETLIKLCIALNLDLNEIFNSKLFPSIPEDAEKSDNFYYYYYYKKADVSATSLLQQALSLLNFSKNDTNEILEYIDYKQHKLKQKGKT